MLILKALGVSLLQKSVNIFFIDVCIKGKGCYLCIPLRRRRLFLEGFRFVSGCCWGYWLAVRWDGKKLKINFAGKEKVLTFAVPNETGFIRTRGAMLRGIREGIGCCGVRTPLRHIGRSVSGGVGVLERY